jgi:hypothetical protein
MRNLIYLLLIFILTQSTTCKKGKAGSNCFKARFEIKAICMNYTFTVIEGNIDTTLVESRWTDPNTGKEYTNAFRLGSPCNLPATLNQGDEFYFTIDNTVDNNCAVCKAYYPVPAKALNIRVIEGPCLK